MSIIAPILTAIFVYYWFFIRPKNLLKNQILEDIKFNIKIVSLDPPDGSTIRVGEKINVTFRYECRAELKQKFSAWLMINEDFGSSYQPSVDSLKIGQGRFKRWISSSEVGTINSLMVNVQTQEYHQSVYEKDFYVNYKVIENKELNFLKDDGVNSQILAISFKPSDSKPVKKGTDIIATLDYDIKSKKGLNIYVIPEFNESRSGTYESSDEPLNGRGQAKRYFNMGSACYLDAVIIQMYNQAQELVLEERHLVNYNFID